MGIGNREKCHLLGNVSVKHCEKHSKLYIKVSAEYLSLFVMNFMPIITFSIFIVDRYKAVTGRVLVVYLPSYVSRETLLKYSSIYNGADARTLT